VDIPALVALDARYRTFMDSDPGGAGKTTPRTSSRGASRGGVSSQGYGSGNSSPRTPRTAHVARRSLPLSVDWRQMGLTCASSSPRVAQECLYLALTLAPRSTPAHAMALVELGTLHLNSFSSTSDPGAVQRALRYLRTAVDVDRSTPVVMRGRARLQLSAAFNSIGRHTQALSYAQEAEKLLGAATPTAASDHARLLEMRAVALHNACACHEHLGQYGAALDAATRAMRFASESGAEGSESLVAQLAAVEASVRARATLTASLSESRAGTSTRARGRFVQARVGQRSRAPVDVSSDNARLPALM